MWPSLEQVHRAAIPCGKRKRNRPDAIRFRLRYGEEILELTQRLQSQTYRPEPGTVFVVNRPKFREIHAAHFRDRVVHHLIHQHLEPVFEKSFISDSYACRKGRGTLAAVQTLQRKMREITRNGQIRAYAIQLDVKAFFPSIHKDTLIKLLEAKRGSIEKADEVLNLARIIIQQDPAEQAKKLGKLWRFKRVPEHKRLGSRGPGYGLPIGNLTSQFFGNVYLNPLDQFVKRTLGVGHYVRYCDDSVLLHTDLEQLRVYEQKIRAFLKERLQLDLQESFVLKPVSEGINFLGYIVRPSYLLPRRRIIKNAQNRITELEQSLKPRRMGRYSVCRIDSDAIEKLRSSWASYAGHLKHSDSNRILRKLWSEHDISRLFLTYNASFRPRFAKFALDRSWREQVKRLSIGVWNRILMIEVGCFLECPRFFDRKRLKLKTCKNRMGRWMSGFPKTILGRKLESCLSKGYGVIFAVQEPEDSGRLRSRRLACLICLLF